MSCSLMHAADLYIDLADKTNEGLPPGFKSVLGGTGKPGKWIVLEDEVPGYFKSFSEKAATTNLRPVLAQVSEDLTDEHFPMLIYTDETFKDFRIETKFKLVRGVIETMAGLVFRFQDVNNYYYVRASGSGKSFAFFKVVNGVRSEPVRVGTQIPEGQWHAMSVDVKGASIKVTLNGKPVLPEMNDYTFTSGKIGFWTKSDAVSYFAGTVIRYQPMVIAAQRMVENILKDFPRIKDLKLFAPHKLGEPSQIIAAMNPSHVGEKGDPSIEDVISRGNKYYAKNKRLVTMTLPVKDRNGDPIAAVRVTVKSFLGQTQANAFARAIPILEFIQGRVLYLKDFYQ
ncbi:MAG: DUF1080 domain-containing protein [Verrucomicrobiota bacterium]|nr:DUF1080 domain-containing protein [Verrucomicrobiota bacterium]